MLHIYLWIPWNTRHSKISNDRQFHGNNLYRLPLIYILFSIYRILNICFLRIYIYVSWVQALRWSLSPPEVTTSHLPGLNCPNSTHLPLITLPAVPHHHSLLIPLSPATLSGFIVCICVGHSCFVFLPCWLFFLIKAFHLQLDPFFQLVNLLDNVFLA